MICEFGNLNRNLHQEIAHKFELLKNNYAPNKGL
jgi:hypothetical protein